MRPPRVQEERFLGYARNDSGIKREQRDESTAAGLPDEKHRDARIAEGRRYERKKIQKSRQDAGATRENSRQNRREDAGVREARSRKQRRRPEASGTKGEERKATAPAVRKAKRDSFGYESAVPQERDEN
jgi:hypothetical protein